MRTLTCHCSIEIRDYWAVQSRFRDIYIYMYVGKSDFLWETHKKTRRLVEHCTPHVDGAWLNELGWSQ